MKRAPSFGPVPRGARRRAGALAAVPCLLTLAAWPLVSAAVEFSVNAGPAWYESKEPLPGGGVANRDKGQLTRVSLGARHTIGDWRFDGSLSQATGAVGYDGRSQLGIPIFTTTDLRRHDAELTAQRLWPLGDGAVTVGLGGGFGLLRIGRDIRATPASSQLTETLRSRQWLLMATASTTSSLMARPLRLSLLAQGSRPASQTLDVDAHGAFDPLRLKPKARWGGRLAIAADLDLSPAWTIGLTAGYDVYRPGASDSAVTYQGGIPSGSGLYPGSDQRLRHVGISLTGRL